MLTRKKLIGRILISVILFLIVSFTFNKIIHYKSEIQQKVMKIEELEHKVIALKDTISIIKRKEHKLKAQILGMEKDIQRMELRNSRLTSEVSLLKKELTQKRTELQSVRAKLIKKESRLNQVKNQKIELSKVVKEKDHTIEGLSLMVDGLNKSLDQVESNKDATKVEISRIKSFLAPRVSPLIAGINDDDFQSSFQKISPWISPLTEREITLIYSDDDYEGFRRVARRCKVDWEQLYLFLRNKGVNPKTVTVKEAKQLLADIIESGDFNRYAKVFGIPDETIYRMVQVLKSIHKYI